MRIKWEKSNKKSPYEHRTGAKELIKYFLLFLLLNYASVREKF